MVQIGTIEYEARVTGAADAKKKTDNLQESQEDLAEASEESASSMNGFAGVISRSGDSSERSARSVGIMGTATRLLGSTAAFTAGSLAGLAGKIVGVSGASAAGAKAVGLLKAGLSSLTLSGVVGSVVGGIKGFAAWLAAGSAGALAFAGAIGVGVGLLGVWILKVTGALGAVKNFGSWVGNVLPGFVSDGILQMIGLVAGPLAALGGFIIGTFEGGFGEGIARAREVVGIFVGAWERQIGRVVDFGENAWDSITSGALSMKNDVVGFFGDIEDAATNQVRAGFNAVVPSSVDIPSATLSAPDWAGGMSKTIGGGSINLPQLQVGGTIEESGAAVVHEGEAVIPEPIVSAAEQDGGGGGGGGDVQIDVGDVVLKVTDPGFDPSDLSRREINSLADRLIKAMGKKTSNIAGTR